MMDVQVLKQFLADRGKLDFWPDWQLERAIWVRDEVSFNPILAVGCRGAELEEIIYAPWTNQAKFHGIDIHWDSLHRARDMFPNGVFHYFDITEEVPWPFIDKSFPIVTLCEILEHLHPIYFHRVLAEAMRIAWEKVLITVPNGECEYYSLICSADHKCIYTEQLFHKLLNLPESERVWFETTGRAIKVPKKFNYKLAKTPSERFLLVKIYV